MSATATPVSSHLQTQILGSTHVQIGLHEERPCPGAIAYQALAALTTTTSYRNPRLTPPHSTRRVALALTEAPRQEDADSAHIRLLESISPLLALGQSGLALAVELIQQGVVRDSHQVLLWSDGVHARLLFHGNHRIIYLHDGNAALIRPGTPDGIGHCELPLHPGDILVMVANATHAQLPLGTVAAMAREATTPQALCERATHQAASSEPMSHHATLALSVSGTSDDQQ